MKWKVIVLRLICLVLIIFGVTDYIHTKYVVTGKYSIACITHPGSSNFGTSTIQYLPPSYTCDWSDYPEMSALEREMGLTKEVRGPHHIVWPYLLALGLGGLLYSVASNKNAKRETK